MNTEQIIEALNKASSSGERLAGIGADGAGWYLALEKGWAAPTANSCDFVDMNGNIITWNDQASRWEHGGSLTEWLEGRS